MRSLIIQSCQSLFWTHISSTYCAVPVTILLASLHLPISSSISVILLLCSTTMGGLNSELKPSLGFEPLLKTASQVCLPLTIRTGWARKLVKCCLARQSTRNWGTVFLLLPLFLPPFSWNRQLLPLPVFQLYNSKTLISWFFFSFSLNGGHEENLSDLVLHTHFTMLTPSITII